MFSLSLLGFLVFCLGGCSSKIEEADSVFVNGRVYKVDLDRSWSEAIAVSEGKIEFVGSSKSAQRYIGPNTQVLDLKSKSGYHLYILRIETKKTNKTRLQLVNYLNKNNIQVGFHYIPIFTHRYFKSFRMNEKDFSNTEVFSKTAFSLPLYNQLSKKNLRYIVKIVKDFFKK